MSKIVKLEPNVFNMIAAGEVVERPASVVKELVENSLDAGANSINIDIIDGGLSLIRVSDNGVGMDKEDIMLSIVPHATSKLFSARDLSSISTFGFRGEALASIEAVSKVKITSCKNGECYTLDSQTKNLTLSSRTNGTTIEICDLFFNTPARLKFLKSNKAEEKYILEKVSNLILANPNVSFTLNSNGKTSLTSQGDNLTSAIFSVYGSIADKFYPLSYKKENFSLNGFISPFDVTRSSRSGQVIIINGRVVKDNSIQIAVEKAYGNSLMKHTYPLYILSLVLPFDFVDVNVHPQKSEVRFQNPSNVFGFVYKAICETLSKQQMSFKLAIEDAKLPTKCTTQYEIGNIDFQNQYNDSNTPNLTNHMACDNLCNDNKSGFLNQKIDVLTNKFGNNSNEAFLNSSNILDEIKFKNLEKNNAVCMQNIDDYTQKYSLQNLESEYARNKQFIQKENLHKENDYEKIEALCSLFSTYLIIKKGEEFFIVDQHAAHEKILYNKLMASIQKHEIISQPMLFSYSEIVDSDVSNKIVELLPSLNKIGFEIEILNNEVKFLAIPALLTNLKIKDFLHNLTNIFSDVNIETFLYEKICQTACKAAIKGGDNLNEDQIDYLIKTFNQFGLPTQCPHGRPAIIKIEKQALEKLFKRIV